jgi:hypothetical protein
MSDCDIGAINTSRINPINAQCKLESETGWISYYPTKKYLTPETVIRSVSDEA